LIFGHLLRSFPDKYELHQLALWHSYPLADIEWPVYPTAGILTENGFVKEFDSTDLAGEKTFPALVEKIKPDIVFAFNDPQRLAHVCAVENRSWRLVLYVTIDGAPFPPGGGEFLNRADMIVTMSGFSRNALLASSQNIRPEKVLCMYAPADTDRFTPVSDEQKTSLRQSLFPPWMPRDSFVLGWVGRMQWRKQNWILYEVISHLRKGGYIACERCGNITIDRMRFVPGAAAELLGCRHCGNEDAKPAPPLRDIFLWLHMHPEPSQDWNPRLLEMQFVVRPGDDIHYTQDHRIGNWKHPRQMPQLYQSWDALLYLSGGEGFGVPAWEAISSGLPVIYTNYSAHGEFLSTSGGGIAVEGTLQPERKNGIFRMIADVEEAIHAARNLYFDRALGPTLGTRGRGFADQFTPCEQVKRWNEIFEWTSRSNACSASPAP
jgi:glycosyltransferase involved in cell wall biosynthesis